MLALAACAAFCCATNPQESSDVITRSNKHLVDLGKRWLSAEELVHDLRGRIYPSAGIVNGIVVTIMPQGRVKRMIFTDVLVYRDGKWRSVNAQELPLNERLHL